tara:strand:+ start:1005 stop:1259 length:255 start_codon:yes stop_codon:yes gene_type:complete
MPKSKKRGGAKAHRKRVKARNEKIKLKQDTFIKQFRERFNQGVTEEIEKQASEVKKSKETSGENITLPQEKTVMDTPMGTAPTK